MQLHHSKTASEAKSSLQCRRCAKFATTVVDPNISRPISSTKPRVWGEKTIFGKVLGRNCRKLIHWTERGRVFIESACHAMETKSWCKITRGFIPRKIHGTYIQAGGH